MIPNIMHIMHIYVFYKHAKFWPLASFSRLGLAFKDIIRLGGLFCIKITFEAYNLQSISLCSNALAFNFETSKGHFKAK